MPRARHLGAIRGAITVDEDDASAIRAATAELLRRIVALNHLTPADIISALFTVTPDLRSAFPAHAARDLGWTDVALLCTMEIPVPDAIARCIRVLLQWKRHAKEAARHVYLRGARALP